MINKNRSFSLNQLRTKLITFMYKVNKDVALEEIKKFDHSCKNLNERTAKALKAFCLANPAHLKSALDILDGKYNLTDKIKEDVMNYMIMKKD